MDTAVELTELERYRLDLEAFRAADARYRKAADANLWATADLDAARRAVEAASRKVVESRSALNAALVPGWEMPSGVW